MEGLKQGILRAALCAALLWLAGCSMLNVFENRHVDYKSTASVPSL